MNLKFHPSRKGLIRLSQTIAGALIISQPIAFFQHQAQAQISPLNPCPGIYYEEPFNSTRIVPQGCPANTATQQQLQQGQSFDRSINSPATSYPSQLQSNIGNSGGAIATISPVNGTVDIQLRNETNTSIAYQAIGQTQQQVLQGGESITLRGLPIPSTVTMYRPDGGFIQVVPNSSSSGAVAISLNETSAFDQNASAIRIQPDGQIYLQ